ncbi:MAG TPA: hypothetical protein VK453_08290 [Micromonosporaceae bacterium]|nr:hypothetical protein [Micromonosporaceae bacterium]
MNVLRDSGWRIALIASAVLMVTGAPRHPSSDAKDPMREELAIMTSHPDWVPAHLFVMLSTMLFAAGLIVAYRKRVWPDVQPALGIAAVAVAVYVIETGFHLAAVVDSHALHHGGATPVATTHIWLSVVLYPLTGLAVSYLGIRQLVVWRGTRRLLGLPAAVGGLAHAVSVPLTLALPDAELSPVFAASAMLFATYALVNGVAGVPRPAVVPAERQPVTV